MKNQKKNQQQQQKQQQRGKQYTHNSIEKKFYDLKKKMKWNKTFDSFQYFVFRKMARE